MAQQGIICAVLLLCYVVPSMATVYTVGDSLGWRPDVSYFYWAEGKTFLVGDSLVFNYGSGDSVYEVPSSLDTYACKTENAISSDNSGHTIIPLTRAGAHHFICGVPSRCAYKMQFDINVQAAGANSTSTPSSGTTYSSPPI